MSNALWAMLFGLIGTVLFHLGKGMQKRGIGFIRVVGNRAARRSLKGSFTPQEIRTGSIYITGIIINNSLILWILLANIYAPPSYFSSVFGIGIIALVIYARFLLEETITGINYFGMTLIVFGTVMLGVESIRRVELSIADANLTALWIIIAAYLIFSIISVGVMLKISRPYLIGISFGLFTGGMASLDPVLKGVAQNYGGIPGIVPSTMEGWGIFFFSFLFASASFIGTQWGFMKNSPASIQVPVASSVYVCFPIMIQGITLPGFKITPFTIAGMLSVVGGILFLTGRSIFSNEKRGREAIP